jgi:MFS family permease
VGKVQRFWLQKFRSYQLLKTLQKLLPLYIGAALGPLCGFGVVTLLPVLAQDWSVDFGTASLAITFYMAPFIIIQIFSGAIAQLFDTRKVLFFGFGTYALVLVSMVLITSLPYSFMTYFILFLILGTGAATAWTSLNTMAVQISSSMRKPVTSVYNATKFTGYGLARLFSR